MKPFKKLAAVFALAAALAVLITGCDTDFIDGMIDLVSELEGELNSGSVEDRTGIDEIGSGGSQTGDANGSSQVKTGGIPFRNAPEIPKYELPAETFDDPLEKEASGVIDKAICSAIACTLAMKDDRHSSVSFPFEEDANGFLADLSKPERDAFEKIVAAGKTGKALTISEKEFGGDLKKAFFDFGKPLEFVRPDVSSYLFLDAETYIDGKDESHYRSVFGKYFDPYKDENAAVSAKTAMGSAKLLDHVVKRVVRFMPEGLTTYDKYYYLAAVVCEKAFYDDRPDNCYTAFGALITGKCVCEGYCKAFYLLCGEADLFCAYRFSGTHMWNMVRLESGVYNVDLTWCDNDHEPYSYRWYDYFVKSDRYFAEHEHEAKSGVAATGDFEPCPYESTRS